MKINSLDSTNFKALSIRAASVGLLDAKNNPDEKEKVEKIIVNQAKNGNYHIDFQNYGFVVCKAKINYSRLNETSSQKVVNFEPVSERMYSLSQAAIVADKLEEQKRPYNSSKKAIADKILNYTI